MKQSSAGGAPRMRQSAEASLCDVSLDMHVSHGRRGNSDACRGVLGGRKVSHEVSQASTREPDPSPLSRTREQKRHLRQDDARGENKARNVKLCLTSRVCIAFSTESHQMGDEGTAMAQSYILLSLVSKKCSNTLSFAQAACFFVLCCLRLLQGKKNEKEKKRPLKSPSSTVITLS